MIYKRISKSMFKTLNTSFNTPKRNYISIYYTLFFLCLQRHIHLNKYKQHQQNVIEHILMYSIYPIFSLHHPLKD